MNLPIRGKCPPPKEKKLKTYCERYERFVKPKSNFRIARFKLRAGKQADGESVDKFIKGIRLVANECAYLLIKLMKNLIDTLIFGCVSETVKSKLLQKDMP